MQVTYYVMRTNEGWRVVSRGFAWEFDTLTRAFEFALDMAEQYAAASGRTTNVRMQDEANGEFRDARTFVGVTPLHAAARSMARSWTR